jgi:hypothetical protein
MFVTGHRRGGFGKKASQAAQGGIIFAGLFMWLCLF